MAIIALTTTKHLAGGVEVIEIVKGERYETMPLRIQHELIDQGLAKDAPAKKTPKGASA